MAEKNVLNFFDCVSKSYNIGPSKRRNNFDMEDLV